MSSRIFLEAFERSPRLSELKVAYKNRVKTSECQAVQFPQDAIDYVRAIWDIDKMELTEDFLMTCLKTGTEDPDNDF